MTQEWQDLRQKCRGKDFTFNGICKYQYSYTFEEQDFSVYLCFEGFNYDSQLSLTMTIEDLENQGDILYASVNGEKVKVY